jgi:hypothetical protein
MSKKNFAPLNLSLAIESRLAARITFRLNRPSPAPKKRERDRG